METHDRLYNLLPSIYRVRDSERGEPLRALLAVMEEQLGAVETDITGLYENWFIETCDEWVVPYLGDLLGIRGLHPAQKGIYSQRAYVANTLSYRRRKGTATALEQLARDITGFDARVVEFFDRLTWTANMNHTRKDHPSTLSLRHWEPLKRLNTPFDDVAHNVDVRRIAVDRGKYNIPNVGIFLWRIGDFALTNSPALSVDALRFRFSTLGNDFALFNRPVTQTQVTELAQPLFVPMPISRRVLKNRLFDYYGDNKSLLITIDGAPVPIEQISVCELSGDDGGSWSHVPGANLIAIDPELGRLAFNSAPAKSPVVTYHYGFSAEIGGGEYRRADTFMPINAQQIVTPLPASGNIQDGINLLPDAGGAVEIRDSGRYERNQAISTKPGQLIEIRASESHRPHLRLKTQRMTITGDAASVTLNGLVISGFGIVISGNVRKVILRHCTLVPGSTLDTNGEPQKPNAASVTVEKITLDGTFELEMENCIVGTLIVPEDCHVALKNTIVDATSSKLPAYAGSPDGANPGAPVIMEKCTVIGKVYARILELVSNSILDAGRAPGDLVPAVRAQRRQEGCVRFSCLPFDSEAPRRFHCQPGITADVSRVSPQFNSTRYGTPDYCQLSLLAANEIKRGADDEGEMGVFHDVYAPQREDDLRLRLDEYLPFGLEVGIYYGS